MRAALPHLVANVNNYNVCDILNVYECELFYKLAPHCTIEKNNRPLGRKVSKERITVLVFSNADSTEKFELMFIETAWKAKIFSEMTGREHGFRYHASKNAWLTKHLLHDLV